MMKNSKTKVQSNDYWESGWGLGSTGLSTTKEGYLQGRICVTGAGVFKYYDENGKIRYRLRSVDEVSKATQGLNSLPLTLRHPKELVNTKNFKDVAVGYAGTDATFDGLNCFVTVTITDDEAIRAIREGKVKAVSCGYESFINDDVGVWQGSDYDQVQESIEYNHIALVLEGRAGDGVKFRLNDAVELYDEKNFNSNERKDNAMRKIQIDSVEYEADEAVISALKTAQKDSAEKQKALDTVTAERDAAKALCDEKDKEIKAIKDAAASQDFKSMVKARIALEKVADEAGIEKASEMDDKSIKAAVIGKAFEGVSLDGKSDDYVQAMFDAACNKGFKKGAQVDNSLNGDKITNKDSKDYQSDESVEASRNAFAAKMRGEGGK